MYKRLGIFFLCCVVNGLAAQRLPVENYTPANGLVDARVSGMFQDSKGRLYFLTREGFSIFDGQQFDNYGLPNTYGTGIISDIAEFSEGVVEIFGFDGDIYRVINNRVVTDTSKRYILREISKVHGLAHQDKLILTNHKLIRETAGKFQLLNVHSINLERIENSIQSGGYLLLLQHDENRGRKVFLYNYTDQQIEDSIPIYGTVSFIKNINNSILIATKGKNWFKLDSSVLQSGKIKLLQYNSGDLVPVNFTPYKILTSNDNNNVWFVNAEKGYCQVNMTTHKKKYFPIEGIKSDLAGWVFEDAEKNCWFGPTESGVQKWQWSSLVKLATTAKTALGYVTGISKTEKNESFINSTGGIFINEKRVRGFAENRNSFTYWQGQHWYFSNYKTLRSDKGRVFYLDQLIPGYDADDFSPSFNSIDSKGRLVIAGKIFIIIDRDYHFTCFKAPGYCDNIVETNENEYWCFLRNHELIKLLWDKDTIRKMYSGKIANLAARFAVKWDANTFLVGTRLEGIKILKWAGNRLTVAGTINKLNGLSNNFVNVLLKKDDRHLLAGTGTGLDEITFSGTDTIVENLSQRNNVYVSFTNLVQFYDSSVLCHTSDGELFKLTNSARPVSAFSPSAFFKTISVNKQAVDLHSEINFDHNRNNFFFLVSTPCFSYSRRIRFNFTLSGNEMQWQQHSNNPGFEINNLLPGTYSLMVLIQYPGKIYPDKQLHYHFTIAPPFWERWWFMLLSAGAAIAFILYGVQRFYKRRFQKKLILLEKQQAVEKERTRIATDMHDDFGATLNRIKFISEKIQALHTQDENINIDLGKISAYSDEMAEKMNEIVWALNQRNDSAGDLISFCRHYAADYLQDKNIKLIFLAGNITNKIIEGELRRNIFLVVKEALFNVVKHAGASAVTIEFKEQGMLMVTIKDDGIGIDKNNIRPFANGINNMTKRIESIGGSINICSTNGTVITIGVPL
jgi:signal transduction histidine kinase